MKRTLISAAVASALVGAAGSALAIAPGAIPANISTVRMSGATAQDQGVLAIARRLCNVGTLDVYNVAGNSQAFVCTAGAPLNKAIAIVKENAVGSQNGLSPVRLGTALSMIDPTKLTTANCGTAGTSVASVAAVAPDTIGLPAYTNWTCSAAATTAAAPQIGFSDVDPGIFGETSSGLTLQSPNQLLFGVPLSKALRDALQTAQGLTAGSELSADQPSLSRAQIAGLYSGGIATGSGLDADLADNPIYIARRVDTSGSQKAAELYFLLNQVNPLAPPAAFLAADAGSGTGATQVAASCGSATVAPAVGTVFAGNGSGDVRNCLNAHNAGGRFAVGVLSTESNQYQAGAGWRFAKINGVMPTIANAIKGTYEYYTEQVITSRPTISGDALTVRNYFNTQLGDPNVISTLTGNFTVFTGEPAGQQRTGLMAPPDINACPVKFAGTTTPDNDPINVASKSIIGGALDNRVIPALAVCPSRF